MEDRREAGYVITNGNPTGTESKTENKTENKIGNIDVNREPQTGFGFTQSTENGENCRVQGVDDQRDTDP